jgi:glycosyltransferase involved in cell wall biosynthesis
LDTTAGQEFTPLWIGDLELSSPALPARAVRSDGNPFTRARILVRSGATPLGFIETDLADGQLLLEEIVQQARSKFSSDESAAARDDGWTTAPGPSVAVVLCTHNRPEGVLATLNSLLGLRYPDFEVIIVDNAPSDGLTADAVARFAAGERRVRYVCEPLKGLSRARNRGLAEARSELVAFTDDDVRVDPFWLHGLVRGFNRDSNVACVTGLVVSSSLEHPAEQYFDKRIWWAWQFEPRLYKRQRSPRDSPLHPYAAGTFGAGANFAARVDVLRSLGGFDQCLGAGSPTQGGEDLDIFLRMILSGHALSYEPCALVWHDNRVDDAALQRQMYTYGLGLTAYLAKYLLARATRGEMARKALAGLKHVGLLMRRSRTASTAAAIDRQRMAGLELRGMLAGPVVYLHARRAESREHLRAVAPVASPRPRDS